MNTLLNYTLVKQIYDSPNSLVYRAVRADNQAVILKRLKADYPTPVELIRYRQEFEILSTLDLPGVVKVFDCQSCQNTLLLEIEDFGGDSLTILNQKRRLSVVELLPLFIQVTESLGQVHAADLIHKDINPNNIVCNVATGQIKLIDFGIATRLPRENPLLKSPEQLEGTLAYISPEQTGRMNRALDYRTDLYSLGVTFYELLTGQLPFVSKDPLEVVHGHIAKRPVPAHEINPHVPRILSDVVMKLMAKNAEDRYQSAFGLKYDLEKIQENLNLASLQDLPGFELGQQDISGKFHLPQKLYGREPEIEILWQAFERISQGSAELLLIAGYSGIGKTALVQELYKPMTAKRGYFIVGKFDQFQRNIPYSAIVAAFRQLIQQLLTEPMSQLVQWQMQLKAALGVNGQVIVEVIPEMELIIGQQLPVPELGPTESQNRFNLVFQNFIRACCAKEHPLVIFLDDLQWADSATLKLIELMMTDTQLPYLLLLGAYRDNEVSLGHPLLLVWEELKKSRVTIQQLTLANLQLEDLSQLIADTLNSEVTTVKPLAELVFTKTAGNPFFVTQFLKTLYTEGFIHFVHEKCQWQWDQAYIEAQNITDNVVELLIGKLQKLPAATQVILPLAACVGASFDLQTLAIIAEKPSAKVFDDLQGALVAGLILTTSELDEHLLTQKYQSLYDQVRQITYSLIPKEQKSATHLEIGQLLLNSVSMVGNEEKLFDMDKHLFCHGYKFLHDRVQQAAYSLIPEEKKPATHLKIGQLLLNSASTVEKEEKLFDMVEHLNRGQTLITVGREREALAALNLKAGRKARNGTAYAAAMSYLQTGIGLLEENGWQTQYELTLHLYVAATEVAYLNTDFEGMERIAAHVLQQANTILDKIKVYEIQILARTGQSRMLEAIAVGREALAQLGVELPSDFDQTQIDQAFDTLDVQLQGRRIEDLIDLPVMTHPETQAAMQLLGMLFAPILLGGNPASLPLLSSTMVSLSLQFGNAPASTMGYALHGMALCAFSKERRFGYDFGRLALNLLERFDAQEFKSTVHNLFGAFIQHYREAIKSMIPTLKAGYQAGMETGDFLSASYNISNSSYINFFSGFELNALKRELATYSSALAQSKQYSAQNYMDTTRQAVENLIGVQNQPDRLIGTIYDETVMILKYHQDNEFCAIAYVYIHKLLLAYCFSDYTVAIDYITKAKQHLVAVSGTLHVPIFHFYAALTYFALYPTQTPEKQPETLAQAEIHQTIVYQLAQDAPMNYWHKWQLLEAEKQRVLGHKAEAIELYDCAIAGAKTHHFVNEEALANEVAARFYLQWGKEKLAQDYLREAHYAYTLWGALAKVKDLEQKYPSLQAATKTPLPLITTTLTDFSTDYQTSSTLDLATVIKASQTISKEIVLDKLLVSLMKIIIQNAGAQVGYLILVNEGKLTLEATGTLDSEPATGLQSLPLEDCQTISQTIVNYVARTHQSVVLENATQTDQFTHDPYIKQYQPQSVLCTPLINQGKLVSIVYLENNLTPGAFTRKRVEIVNLLSAQAAISLKNAQLYQHTVALNRAYQRFVPRQFLHLLDKLSIIEVELGDQVQLEMSVLFSDIRSFTTLSEKMSPADNFKFINAYLSRMQPVISQHQGFIDKYIGDAIMALFSGDADNAVQAGITMLHKLAEYNDHRQKSGYIPIQIGIGINTGLLMLGTVGGQERMDGTVISDAVNLASRVEGMTKMYGTALLITEHTYSRLRDASQYAIREIDKVKVKGKAQPVTVYEVFDGETEERMALKRKTLPTFEYGLTYYRSQNFNAALACFQHVLQVDADDKAAQLYLKRSEYFQQHGVTQDWEGIMALDSK